jgi:hypothetical protein
MPMERIDDLHSGERDGDRREAGPPESRVLLGGMSRQGLAPAVLASAALVIGMALVTYFGRHYLDLRWQMRLLLLAGICLLVLAGWMATRLARRSDYPWLMFVAVVALPLFQPQNKPDGLSWRLLGAAYGFLLVVLTVYAFARMVGRSDELERRVNQEALAFAFGSSVVLAIAYSLLQDLLPPLQGVWVAAAMSATWLLGWNLAWRRYR